MNKNTLEIWRGRSELDGEPIVLLASGFDLMSANGKTGDMIQTWILHADVEPHEAVKTGQDGSVCGDCVLRGDGSGKNRPCYVTVFRAPLAIWRSWKNGNVERRSPEQVASILARDDRDFRLGSYGDPAAVPFEVWEPMAAMSRTRTGYTHQWRVVDPRFRSICMASVDTPEQYHEARENGWRTFRTRHASMDLLEGELICPASEEGGKRTSCDKCGLCNGKKDNDKRRSVAIIAHGPTATRWADAVGMAV